VTTSFWGGNRYIVTIYLRRGALRILKMGGGFGYTGIGGASSRFSNSLDAAVLYTRLLWPISAHGKKLEGMGQP